MNYQTGDIIFVHGKSVWSNLITWFSFTKISHVACVADGQIYETDGAFAKSVFSKLDKLDKYDRWLVRYKGFKVEMIPTFDAICKQRAGTPYAYGDIVLRGLLFWMNEKAKGSIAEWMGSSKYTICSEEVELVSFATYKHPVFEHPERDDPGQLFDRLKDHKDFECYQLQPTV